MTSGTSELIQALRGALPEDVPVAALPASDDTSFENTYEGGARRQYLRGRADQLAPPGCACGMAPGAAGAASAARAELDPALARAFPSALIAATPQGWLRRWHDNGAVYPGDFAGASAILPALDALIVSREDLLPSAGSPGGAAAGSPRTETEADELIAGVGRVQLSWSPAAPQGALLCLNGGRLEPFAGYAARGG